MKEITIEDVLKKHIEEYNSTVNDMHKFKLSERELKMFSAAMTEYASLNRQGWMRVEDGLPEVGEHILVVIENSLILTGKLMNNNIWVAYFADGEQPLTIRKVTHWMPLPNKPETI